MRGRFSFFFAAVLAATALAGCTLFDGTIIRIHRSDKNDVIRSRMKLPNFIGPREKVQHFFQYYKNRDWKSMESALSPESDFLAMRDQMAADFNLFSDMEIHLEPGAPEFNDAQDKAQVKVKFEIEKINAKTGSLILQSGTGTFILTEKGNWDILGYLGDPFWGTGKKKKK